MRKDYLGTEGEISATIYTIRDLLRRGNGIYMVQYLHYGEKETAETAATGPASQWVNHLLNGLR